MKNRTGIWIGIIIIIILLIILGFFWSGWGNMNTNETPGTEATTTTETATSTTAVFTNPQSGEDVTVVFSKEGDTATLNGLSFSNVVLHATTSASGARYVNTEKGLQVWNVGQNVMISENGEQVFKGNIGGLTAVDKLETGTWTWLATNANGTSTEPKDADAFTLTFHGDKDTVSATTDCNNIFGPYVVSANNSLMFGDLAMTKKFCEGSQEQVFAEGLSKVNSFYFNGSGALVLSFATSSADLVDGFMLFSHTRE